MPTKHRNDEFYGSLSYWRASGPGFPERPTPSREITYDVAVVGGGFHGLWTAYHLRKADPSLSVAVIEQNHIGFGASGRNGGFAMTKIGLRLRDLERKFGGEAVKRAYEVMAIKVDQLVRTIRAENIDCELDYGGLLVVATNPAQEVRLRKDLEAAERIGITGQQRISGPELRTQVNSPIYLSGMYERHCAVLHPLKLTLGLADIVTRAGAVVFENAQINGINFDRAIPVLRTLQGDIRARKVVMTVNAWASQHRVFRNTIVPVYVYVVATEPISDETWAEIGWEGREGIEDSRSHLQFYRRTHDGRLVFGGTDNLIPFLGRIDKRHDSNARCYERLRRSILTVFPQLGDVSIEYEWGGAFAMTADFLPRYGSMFDGKLVYGHGCCGHGVGLSFFGGEIMRDLILERPTEADNLLFMPASGAVYPGEPLRSIAGSLTLAEARWHDDAQDRGIPASQEPFLLRLAARLLG
jgi:glycine/D-amino acid oxidase-like deaminating enzyme